MNVLDLFSGIGGFSIGLERAGMRTVAFCEIDPYCRRVLAKHWPGVPCYDDVTTLTAARLAADGIVAPMANANGSGQRRPVPTNEIDRSAVQEEWPSRHDIGSRGIDLICGGFPCQDISAAGKGAGIAGARSGLWSEYARIIGEVRPRYVIVENVAALLGRGLERVLGDLATLGYDSEWHCIPASAVGAPHRRDRVWIVAYPNGIVGASWAGDADEEPRRRHANGSGVGEDVADARSGRGGRGDIQQSERRSVIGNSGEDVADANKQHPKHPLPAGGEPRQAKRKMSGRRGAHLADASIAGLSPPQRETLFGSGRWDQGRAIAECGWWLVEPDVGRVAHGVPARVDRLRSLGNSVVPQIPEIIGRAIMKQHDE